MVNKICYIIGAGDNHGLDFVVTDGDYVIAADGGLASLQACGVDPDLVIGDFDSLGYTPLHHNVISLSCNKDHTDTFEAIQAGIAKGYKTFHIYGGTGGRFDHTYANIQTLAYLSQMGNAGYLVGKDYVITAITNGGISFPACCDGYVSVFAYSNEADWVSIQGLKYELDNHRLTSTMPMGVSNEFVGVESVIAVVDGTLIIVFPREYLNSMMRAE